MKNAPAPSKTPPKKDQNRHIGDYLERGVPAPQPNTHRSIDKMLERERAKRKNQP